MRRRMLAGAIAAMLLLCSCANNTVTAPPLVDSISVVYDTARVERGDVTAMVVYDAYVMPSLTNAEFGSVSGVVDELYVHIGDEVRAGDALLKLYTENIEKRLESERDMLESLASGASDERRLVQIDLELARLSLDEAKERGDETAIGLAELEVERREIALSDYDAQYARRVGNIRRSIAEMEQEIEEYTLRAPVAGCVVTLPSVGSYAAAAAPVAVIASENGRMIQGMSSVPQAKQISAVLDGEEIWLERYAYTDREVAQYDAEGKTPPPRYCRADGKELPPSGEYIQLRLVRESSTDTLRLPINAVTYDSGVSYVYRVEGSEKIYTEVKTGAQSSAYIEIVEGLSEGDVVYVGN